MIMDNNNSNNNNSNKPNNKVNMPKFNPELDVYDYCPHASRPLVGQ